MRELIVDVSLYDNVNYQKLSDSGVKAAIIKLGGSGGVDPKARVHYHGFREFGVKVGFYYWVDPVVDAKLQADNTLKLIEEMPVSALFMDNEQWWSNWTKWYAWLRGKAQKSEVPVLSQGQIFSTITKYKDLVSGGGVKNVVNYTAKSFAQEYCTPLLKMMKSVDNWMAYYPFNNKVVRLNSWSDLVPYYPTIVPKPISDYKALVWQWSGDKFYLPGIDIKADLNFWMREDIKLDDYFGGTYVPQPQLPYRITYVDSTKARGLNVRVGPSTSFKSVRMLVPGDPVYIDNSHTEALPWVRLYGEAEEWCHGYYLV